MFRKNIYIFAVMLICVSNAIHWPHNEDCIWLCCIGAYSKFFIFSFKLFFTANPPKSPFPNVWSRLYQSYSLAGLPSILDLQICDVCAIRAPKARRSRCRGNEVWQGIPTYWEWVWGGQRYFNYWNRNTCYSWNLTEAKLHRNWTTVEMHQINFILHATLAKVTVAE